MTSHDCISCNDKDTEIQKLKKLLIEKEDEIQTLKRNLNKIQNDQININSSNDVTLKSKEITRFSRQLILTQIGIKGQEKLKASSVLIVGAGGLGCPVGLYLAAAGVGKIGIVDYDSIEITNLHRQILHTENDLNLSKCKSFVKSLRQINSSTSVIPHELLLNSKNAIEIMKDYNIIVDASDNAPTRYLLNDASCILNKPLISGSALRFEGQLTVYNYGTSPCYRCLYATPPVASAVTNCSEGGVIGAVTGVIGCLQALEVMKIIIGLPVSYENKLLHFDGESGQFRIFNLRGKNPNCKVCNETSKIMELIDYEFFCNTSATDKVQNVSLLESDERISCKDYQNILNSKISHVLLDVRPNIQVQICSLPNSINIPYESLITGKDLDFLKLQIENCESKINYVVCRRGNDSQKAIQFLKKEIVDTEWRDLKGGLTAWHSEIDSNFPIY